MLSLNPILRLRQFLRSEQLTYLIRKNRVRQLHTPHNAGDGSLGDGVIHVTNELDYVLSDSKMHWASGEILENFGHYNAQNENNTSAMMS